MKSHFEVSHPDLTLSPFIGMTKKHYIELAKYNFTDKQKDEIAVTISKWGHHRTTQKGRS